MGNGSREEGIGLPDPESRPRRALSLFLAYFSVSIFNRRPPSWGGSGNPIIYFWSPALYAVNSFLLLYKTSLFLSSQDSVFYLSERLKDSSSSLG